MSLRFPLVLVLSVLPLGSAVPAGAAPQVTGDDSARGARALLAEMSHALKRRRASDELERERALDDVVALIDRITLGFPDYDERERRLVVSRLGKILRTWFDEDSRRVRFAAAAALSEMGPGGAQALRRALSADAVRRDPATRGFVLEALGKHRDRRDVALLLSHLRDDEDAPAASAALALSEFFEADARLRKRIFAAGLAEYRRVDAADRRAKGRDERARRRRVLLEVPLNRLLDRMSGANLDTVEEWTAWYEAHRDEEW